MDSVALAATIGGSVVGLAGVLVSGWGVRQQRLSTEKIATLQHEHERELARGSRLFDRRALVYEQLLTHLYVWQRRVDATERFITLPGDEEPPEPPNFDEWQKILIRLRTFGSSQVADAFDGYWTTIRAFYEDVEGLRYARDRGGPGEASELGEKVIADRKEVNEQLRVLERLMSEELAKL